MSEVIRDQVRKNFNEKETVELLEIWKTNDRVEWSDTAFEVLEEILKNRINDLPPQNHPIVEYEDETEDDGLENWEARLLDNENQPEFYDTLEVLSLKDNVNKLAKAVVFVNIGLAILNFPYIQGVFRGIFPSMQEVPAILWGLLLTVIAVAIEIAIVYFPLKALSQILRILMEIEFNSRKARL